MAKRRSIKHFPYNKNYPAWMIRDKGAQDAGSNVEEDTTLWPQNFADAYAAGRKEFFDRKRKKKHGSHDWYVAQLFKARKVQDIGLRKSLDNDLRKMSKYHRDKIMGDFRATYKKWHDSQAGVRRLTTKNPATRNRARFLSIVKKLQKLDADELFLFWSKHQRGRGATALGFSGPGSRLDVGDLAAFASNIGAAKTTSGDTKKMYERIAHDILMDATKREHKTRKGNPTMARKKTRTAKQRAATKKMLAANRARLRKKTKTARRKTTGRKVRRKTTRRKARRNPQKARPGIRSAFWVVFRCKKSNYGTGARVAWLGAGKSGATIFGPLTRRFLFQTASAASDMAKKYSSAGFYVGVASKTTTGAMLMKHCREQLQGKA